MIEEEPSSLTTISTSLAHPRTTWLRVVAGPTTSRTTIRARVSRPKSEIDGRGFHRFWPASKNSDLEPGHRRHDVGRDLLHLVVVGQNDRRCRSDGRPIQFSVSASSFCRFWKFSEARSSG